MSHVFRGAIRLFACVAFAALGCLIATPARGAIVFGQVDDFENGTSMGWDEGFSPNAPTAVASGGERGTGDAYLRNVSSGGFGAGSKQVMFNLSQWTGNYNAAGVTRLRAWVANFGPDPLHLRVTFASGINQFSSTNAIELAPNGVWRRASFDLTDAALTRVGGAGAVTASEALSNVTELRILSSLIPAHGRDPPVEASNSTLGVDDVRALRPEGDANSDGRVDGADLTLVRSNLGSGATGVSWDDGDFNFDGRVNARDVALLRRNLQTVAPTAGAGASVVPEPAAAFLLALCSLALLLRRRPAVAIAAPVRA